MTLSEVVAVLGPYTSTAIVGQHEPKPNHVYYWEWMHHRLEIQIPEGNSALSAVGISWDPNYHTADGLHPGSSRADVERFMGKPTQVVHFQEEDWLIYDRISFRILTVSRNQYVQKSGDVLKISVARQFRVGI